MQRRSNSRITSSKLDEDGFDDDDDLKSKKMTHNGRGNKIQSSSSTIIPKSLVGTLLIVGLIAIFICISQLASPSSSRGREMGGTRSIRSVKNDIIQPAETSSSSSNLRVAKIINGDDVGITSPTTNATLHVIFSTDCGTFQHWQSYLFFHAALKVKQPGYVTRIASGCTDKQLVEEKEWHEQHIQSVMSDRFRIHFTPHFSGVKDPVTGEVKGDYKFFNKPFGLKHFLTTNDLLGVVDGTDGSMKHPDDVIILTDPDFLLLRPLTDDFSNERETLVGNRRKDIYEQKETHIVSHGNPYAQTYGLGTQWRKFDLDDIAGADSPAKDVTQADGGKLYPAGPPYIGTAKDMHQIAITWSDFAPRVHKQYPHLLAEMYAYCIAAAHLRLPHMLIDSMMVSASGIGGEGWKFVKDIPAREICNYPNHAVHPVPSVIHYCQRYAVDKYFWGKRKVPHDIFTCDHPLLINPPLDLGAGKYLTSVTQKGKEITPEKAKMEAFMVCALTSATNDAMATFKKNHCEGGGNMKMTWNMFTGKEEEDVI